MSLIVFLTNKQTACLAADTRATSTLYGSMENPVTKINVIEFRNREISGAVAGESEINGKHLLDHLEQNKECLMTKDHLLVFRDLIRREWQVDASTTEWESDEERIAYIDSARVDILVIHSPTNFFLLSGTICDFDLYESDVQLMVLGEAALVQTEPSAPTLEPLNWPLWLSKVFQKAGDQKQTVGFPVDLICWEQGRPRSVKRYDTPMALAASRLFSSTVTNQPNS